MHRIERVIEFILGVDLLVILAFVAKYVRVRRREREGSTDATADRTHAR